MALPALDQPLVQRGLPVTPSRWDPATPLVANLEEAGAGIEHAALARAAALLLAGSRRDPG